MPVGLGFLHHGGYLGDVRTFYCPSVSGMQTPFLGRSWDIWGCDPIPVYTNVGIDFITGTGIATLDNLKGVGGWDAYSLTHGDYQPWEDRGWYYATGFFKGMVVQCNYNYRNMPAIVVTDFDSFGQDAVFAAGVNIKYTKPAVQVVPGCPPFKTQKLLAGRAIVADSFSQYPAHIADGTGNPYPGYGLQTHRDGYNVLYGDHHARWYGDPQQRIAWWKATLTGWCPWFGYENAWQALYINTITQWNYVDGTAGTNIPASVEVWNLFDTAEGIDTH